LTPRKGTERHHTWFPKRGADMAREEVYTRVLGTADTDSICDMFFETVLPTNRTHEFFVDWKKIHTNVEALKFEIGILQAVCGSNDVDADLREALRREPGVTAVFPLMIAVRDQKMTILDEGANKTQLEEVHYDFTPRDSLSPGEIDKVVDFCAKTGICALFSSLRVRSLRDYLLGVEAGMDTNARKNRSGTWMERQIEGHLSIDQTKHPNAVIFKQKTFARLAKLAGIEGPPALMNRQFDLVYVDSDLAFRRFSGYCR